MRRSGHPIEVEGAIVNTDHIEKIEFHAHTRAGALRLASGHVVPFGEKGHAAVRRWLVGTAQPRPGRD